MQRTHASRSPRGPGPHEQPRERPVETTLEIEVLDTLTRLAHEYWRRRMGAAGWRPGRRYDEAQRTHDALVPFDELSAHDRRLARVAVRAREIEPLLEDAVDHDRGPEREFAPEEMKVGLPVAWARNLRFDDPAIAALTGEIVSWEVGADGGLSLIRVRWADGEVSEHLPSERELRRP